MLARTSFFHHATYTLIHVDEQKVLRLMGSAANGEMLPSFISRQLQSALGTVRIDDTVWRVAGERSCGLDDGCGRAAGSEPRLAIGVGGARERRRTDRGDGLHPL